ncbi:unnamed protein product, partial [Urochloa humidicola]
NFPPLLSAALSLSSSPPLPLSLSNCLHPARCSAVTTAEVQGARRAVPKGGGLCRRSEPPQSQSAPAPTPSNLAHLGLIALARQTVWISRPQRRTTLQWPASAPDGCGRASSPLASACAGQQSSLPDLAPLPSSSCVCFPARRQQRKSGHRVTPTRRRRLFLDERRLLFKRRRQQRPWYLQLALSLLIALASISLGSPDPCALQSVSSEWLLVRKVRVI